jgi:hypothetical protein
MKKARDDAPRNKIGNVKDSNPIPDNEYFMSFSKVMPRDLGGDGLSLRQSSDVAH